MSVANRKATTESVPIDGCPRVPRIIFINRYFHPDESATSQMLTDLARRLAAERIDVRVVCSRQRYDDSKARLPASESLDGVLVNRVWTSSFGRERLLGRALDYLSFYCTAAVRLWRLTRRGHIVVAKTDPPLLSIVTAVVARLRGASLVNWLQDIFPEVATQLDAMPMPAAVSNLLCSLRDASLRAARCNVVLGQRMRDHLLKLGIDSASIRVIENWADGASVKPQDRGQNRFRLQRRLDDKFVVMYSGNLGRAHEFRTMIDAAGLLRRYADIVFLMVGGGENMRKMRGEVDVSGLANVMFLPYQPRETLTDSLCAADAHLVCLLPALEGLIVPSKFYGILAAGRPVIFIGDPAGELAESIRAADCGAAVAVGAAQQLAESILKLRDDPTLAQAQGERARRAFDTHYTLDAAIAKWRAVLDDVGLSPERAREVSRIGHRSVTNG